MGESDLIYTNTLICHGEEDFRGKTALILGGGDGGILHELLKQNPKHVTMAEVRIPFTLSERQKYQTTSKTDQRINDRQTSKQIIAFAQSEWDSRVRSD